ncbi:ThiJ/PfpI family protein [Cordyceps fumosorosea ARSEF 2679]|uniref:D-lactate dehydratase n=1 Tax=Cordyceps fumosorosea (strain ARSEF 2679) TaxID=1081104 RepID=A0A167QZZ2_CORFA|nr:ThiJ/PfpI family protein [Cordyceps fumosorosea ARSEF 2679]OAA58142.1 ThiJ/PfpI family protein [Cordyceps fumosorosea ARSEF 2679]
MAPQILVVLTSADKIVKLDKPTGWYLPELAHPYDVLSPKAELVFASPHGGKAPLDPGSVEAFKSDASSQNFLKNNHLWEHTELLKDLNGRSFEFAGLFFPGGHGPMYDLVDDKHSIALIEEFVQAGKPVAAVCHGPIVFANAHGADGKPLLQGREVTGFTNEEEKEVGLAEAMPFLLEDRLKAVGAKWNQADKAWGEKVVVDGQIITGQNPASAKGVGLALAKAIGI